MSSPEARARVIAEQQAGVITRQQALSVGVSDFVMNERARRGVWRRLEPGTFLLFGEPTALSHVAGAVASLPAVASHRTAAQIHKIRGGSKTSMEVTVPHRMSNKHPIVDVHESTDLEPAHITTVSGLRVTSVGRTIFDNSLKMTKAQLRATADDALTRKLVTKSELSDLVVSIGRRGRPGTAKMRWLADDLSVHTAVPESELEQRMLALIRSAQLPEPILQMSLPWRSAVDGRVDMTFRDERVIVECDGRRWHTLAESFERDRRRDNQAQAAGWSVLRFTWADVVDRPLETVRQLRAILGAR